MKNTEDLQNPDKEKNMLKIKTGNLDVLESGSVLSFNNEPVEFSFPARDELIIVINFEETENNMNKVWKKEVSGDSKLIIRLINFDNELGIGFSSPEEIAIMGGRVLYISLFVRKINTISSLQYTFYLGRKVV